jgi:hypothetical protein
VPMFCFAFVAFYGFNWSKFSNAESLDHVRVVGQELRIPKRSPNSSIR